MFGHVSQRGLKEFKKHVEKVQAKLRTEDGSYETVKALADVAVHTGGKGVPTSLILELLPTCSDLFIILKFLP